MEERDDDDDDDGDGESIATHTNSAWWAECKELIHL